MSMLNGWGKLLEEKQDSTPVMVIISSFREDGILQIQPPDIIGRPGQRIGVLESGEEFQSARECARNIEGDHKSVLRAARNNREYKERHFKLIT